MKADRAAIDLLIVVHEERRRALLVSRFGSRLRAWAPRSLLIERQVFGPHGRLREVTMPLFFAREKGLA